MKKYIYLLIVFIGILLSNCSESFLDTEPLTQKTNATFYENEEDMFQAHKAG